MSSVDEEGGSSSCEDVAVEAKLVSELSQGGDTISQWCVVLSLPVLVGDAEDERHGGQFVVVWYGKMCVVEEL